jgi:hypothetical protein
VTLVIFDFRIWIRIVKDQNQNFEQDLEICKQEWDQNRSSVVQTKLNRFGWNVSLTIIYYCQRIYHVGYTSSHSITEVKQHWAWLLLRWENLQGIPGSAGTYPPSPSPCGQNTVFSDSLCLNQVIETCWNQKTIIYYHRIRPTTVGYGTKL